MSLDMMHAFEATYPARFSDMTFRLECEAFSRGWVAARDADAATGVEAAFTATYRAPIDDGAWALQASAFRRGWQAWGRFAAQGRRLFCAGRAGVVRVRLQGAATHHDPARQQALQTLTSLLRGAAAPSPTHAPTPQEH